MIRALIYSIIILTNMFIAQTAWANYQNEINIKALKFNNIAVGLQMKSPYDSIGEFKQTTLNEIKGELLKEASQGAFFIEYSQEI